MEKLKIYLSNFSIILMSVCFIFILLEISLRIKNSLILDYDIEMWKYSKKLKLESPNPLINHIHRVNSSAKLQDIDININSLGIRGNDEDLKKWSNAQKKILIIGSSITLGWGIEEDYVLNKIIEKKASEQDLNWIVLNGGVGNYNTERYINNYLENYSKLEPDTLIVQYFINDAEILDSRKGNFFTRNFHIGVFFWKYISLIKSDVRKETIFEHYTNVYELEKRNNYVNKYISKLNSHCIENNIRCIILYTPDLNLISSINKLRFANEYVKNISNDLDMEFLDLTKNFINLREKKLTNLNYNDKHPNSFSHKIMGNLIFEYLIN